MYGSFLNLTDKWDEISRYYFRDNAEGIQDVQDGYVYKQLKANGEFFFGS